MTISIIIPCYNEEENIKPCLKAILGQVELPEEVIFVNNNSTDNSRAVAESFAPKFQQKGISFQIIDVMERGIVPARKAGFSAATSDLIATIDADIVLNKNWIEFAKNYFIKHKDKVALGGPIWFVPLGFWGNIGLYLFNYFPYRLNNFSFNLWGGNMIFRKEAYCKFGGFGDYSKFIQKLNLKYEYDDTFLTEKLRRVGRIDFSFGLKVRAVGTKLGDSNKKFRQSIDFWRIKYYFWKNK